MEGHGAFPLFSHLSRRPWFSQRFCMSSGSNLPPSHHRTPREHTAYMLILLPLFTHPSLLLLLLLIHHFLFTGPQLENQRTEEGKLKVQ